jgi:hypothetical protein
MIILTEAQANNVRGLTISGHALAPRPFVLSGASLAALNGRFGLPEAVVDDAAHELHSAFLGSLPSLPDNLIQKGTPTEGPPGIYTWAGSDWEQDHARCVKYAFSESWVPGVIVVIP